MSLADRKVSSEAESGIVLPLQRILEFREFCKFSPTTFANGVGEFWLEVRAAALAASPAIFLPPTALMSFIQNHDQVGNRAMGDTLTPCAPAERVSAVFAIYGMLLQIPMLFRGEEFASSQPFPLLAYSFSLQGKSFAKRAPTQAILRKSRLMDNHPTGLTSSICPPENDAAWGKLLSLVPA